MNIQDEPKIYQRDLEREAQTGIILSVFNLTNAAVGSGILAFPFAFAKAGLGAGIFLTFIFAVLSGITLFIISYAAKETKVSSIQEVVSVILGRVNFLC